MVPAPRRADSTASSSTASASTRTRTNSSGCSTSSSSARWDRDSPRHSAAWARASTSATVRTARSWSPRSRVVDDAAEAVGLIEGRGHSRRGGAWDGEPGRTPVSGLAIVTDPESGRGRLDPSGTARRRSRGDRRSPATTTCSGHNVKPLMRSLLAAGIDARGSDARHGDRRLSDRPRRGPLHAARPDREVHAVRPSVRRRPRPASSTSTARR